MVYDSAIDLEIDNFGSPVKIVSKSGIVYDDWGNEYTSSESNSTIAVPNDVQGDEDFVIEGNYQPGDKIFFFKSDENNLEAGNNIVFNEVTYRIQDVISHNIQGEQQQYEIRCKRL